MTSFAAVVTEVAAPQPLVLPDAFWVDVTQDDIEQGTPGFSNTCPIARAIKRYFWNVRFVQIEVGGYAEVGLATGFAAYRHTGGAFARAFDRRIFRVEPCRVWFERSPS